MSSGLLAEKSSISHSVFITSFLTRSGYEEEPVSLVAPVTRLFVC